ncbi:MAG: histidine kinase [Saprospiraceae bacterium]|nr:histidine kinase [Saprospiraceae bacterium]
MKKKYRWLFVLAGAVAFVMTNAFSLVGDDRFTPAEKAMLLGAVAVSIGAHFSLVFLVSLWMQKRYPELKQTTRRIGQTLLFAVPLLTVLMGLTDAWQSTFRHEPAPVLAFATLMAVFFQSCAIVIFITGLSEAVHQYEQLLQLAHEKEELMRLNLMAQYDSLKQQVNPHFLFNSLNSLSSLISVNPPQAEKFVEEMSGVYRYLLQSSREELTTLGAELDFLRSYLHLLKTRFGNALQANIEVPVQWLNHRIPPLTLQLLVENAVKHNIVSSSQPLHLNITVENDRLRVSNNLQPKVLNLPSEKVGLANIMARYRLLHQPEVVVENTGSQFVVQLPLIPSTPAS